MGITAIIGEFDKLNDYEQKRVYDIIYSVVNNSSNRVSDYLTEIREARFAKGTYCPYCKGAHIIKHGKYQSRQRYNSTQIVKEVKVSLSTAFYRRHKVINSL
ncbi:hypothetical protein CLHUN_08250 [Ruminiclostridium hungatei]|uniref:Transposase n=1 Tax=Ruminiclostridium hungatei TaxID=48256 RepID=A0A1V4SPR0_RUMHU|nr:hypothetical protein [Ruminiclostridium hungatei]OPX45455.1 hypothetical protein CLHUN_08250 [Ruminiclostridium hungatei]